MTQKIPLALPRLPQLPKDATAEQIAYHRALIEIIRDIYKRLSGL